MANISAELAAIMAAVFGRDVRQSIHDAIYKVNETSEVCISAGTAVTAPNSSSTGYFEKSLYINTDTWELWRCMGVDTWQSLGIFRGNDGRGIVSITGPVTSGLVDTYTIEYTDGTDSTFSITNGADGADGSDGVDGVDGSKWYKGTALTGTGTGITGFPGYKDDFYLNSTDGYVYQCTATGGSSNPGAATWDYVMTLSGGGGGSVTVVDNLNSTSPTDALSANQGRNLDRKKIEKPAGATAGQVLGYDGTDWVPINYTGGGLLPYFYIDSEAGATVTVTAPDGSTITPTAAGTGHWECEVPFYGVYTIHSVLPGQGDATVTVTVDDVKEYHITDNHFDFTINVTAPVGSTVRITGGGETYTGTGTGSPDVYAVHQANTVYTVTATQILDGNTKTDSETVISAATSGQSTSVTLEIEFGTINVSVGAPFVAAGSQITCIKNTEICTPKVAASSLQFRVPSEGVWTISGTVDNILYEVTANVTSLSVPVLVTLETRPDGKTVTPTDVIKTWLECAGIRNKSYTTLAEVLADKETLQTLISDENAVDYMVRSTSWITNKGLVPTMTSNTSPEGEVIYNDYYNPDYPWYAFDGDIHPTQSTKIYTSNAQFASYTPESEWIGYKFTKPTRVTRIDYTNSKWAQNVSFYVEGKNNSDANWTRLNNGVALTAISPDTTETFIIENYNKYDSYRVLYISGQGANGGQNCPNVAQIQFYSSTEEVAITDDPTAMRYIGLRNYASDTLLDDEDWREAICNSEYFESVLNAKVPTLTTSSDKVTCSTFQVGYEGYKAFDGITADTSSVSNAWATSSSVTTGWLAYEFPSPVNVRLVELTPRTHPQAATQNVKTATIEYSDDGSSWIPDESGLQTYAQTGVSKKLIQTNGKHKHWRINVASNYGSTACDAITELQFYGREDVDESVIHIYSAASDNDIHYLNGSTPVTVASTDTDGHGTIARTLLPAGIYDLYSSVAMDPDGDLSTEYFHKEITVKADTIEIMLMPDNTIYWYGYKGDGFSNPLPVPGQNPGAVTETTNYLVLNSSIKSFGKNNIPNADIATAKGLVNTITATNQAMIGMYQSDDAGGGSSTSLTQSGLHVISVNKDVSAVGDMKAYFFAGNDHGNHNVYAFWYE